MADETSVKIYENQGEVDGQPQPKVSEPHDGRHWVDETAVVTDRHVLDPNSDLAVQIPEGSGASVSGHASPLAEALKRGTIEDQFSAGQKDADAQAKKDAKNS